MSIPESTKSPTVRQYTRPRDVAEIARPEANTDGVFSGLLFAQNYPSERTAIKQHAESRTERVCYEVIDP